MESETPRDRNSLRDVAKLAAPAGPAAARRDSRRPSADSSGVVDLEALMKEHPSWLDDALSRAKGGSHASIPSSSSLSALAAPVLLAPPSLAPTSYDDAPSGVPKSSLALIAATIGAIALVVAATGFALKMQTRAPAHVAAAVAVPVTPAPHADDAIAIPPPPPVAEVANAPAAAAVPAANDDPTEANASTPKEESPHSRHGHGHGVHHAALSHFSAAAAPVAAAAPPRPVASKPTKGMSALDAALRGAVPAAAAPASAPAAPVSAAASAPSGDRPDRPSGSAVTSALTSALPAARGCLASGAEPSHARVTFGSNGNVQSVEVTGPAGSNPKATSCLRAAFGRAHVPAFAQNNYAAGVTVRPQ
jgi:hypothetical protein